MSSFDFLEIDEIMEHPEGRKRRKLISAKRTLLDYLNTSDERQNSDEIASEC